MKMDQIERSVRNSGYLDFGWYLVDHTQTIHFEEFKFVIRVYIQYTQTKA